ncbi:MarR family transcriptional regulator [Natronomonas salina]|uniref:helix-turn-helix transcriptional regulator n=1 Tax=Natronomonas salina TaxID=1710540 RepID=UPI0015B78780|nr:MarR family transcriptional regulator [Natronomonas salina]QLD90078.1 MarR family transcriptional regulator [Natronomonas salina]
MIEQLRTIVGVELPPSIETIAPGESGEREGSTGRTGCASGTEARLLPPDERVLELLDAHGGRMWQQQVVAETGYSEGRVSNLLGEMEADGLVTRRWKGGQKVVSLPERGPES